jgi:hypothetical protein
MRSWSGNALRSALIWACRLLSSTIRPGQTRLISSTLLTTAPFASKGELILLENASAAAGMAADHFRQALDWARAQGALSWELRAAVSLARLWRGQGRSKDARELLAPVYDRLTEGFETADLEAARALIGDLREPYAYQIRGK